LASEPAAKKPGRRACRVDIIGSWAGHGCGLNPLFTKHKAAVSSGKEMMPNSKEQSLACNRPEAIYPTWQFDE
jgi:hypothetical protein